MVVDYMDHIMAYSGTSSQFEEGIRLAYAIKDKPPGRYEQGDIYAMVQEGMTGALEEGLFEAHRKYIDLQIMLEGEELISWEAVSRLQEKESYDEGKDFELFCGEGQNLSIKAGMFYLVFPHDGHMPCRHVQKSTEYRKIVVKLKAE